MKQKHVDALREARLWFVQVIIPAIILFKTPEVKEFINDKIDELKGKYRS